MNVVLDPPETSSSPGTCIDAAGAGRRLGRKYQSDSRPYAGERQSDPWSLLEGGVVTCARGSNSRLKTGCRTRKRATAGAQALLVVLCQTSYDAPVVEPLRVSAMRRFVAVVAGLVVSVGSAAFAGDPAVGISLDARQLNARLPHATPTTTRIAPRTPRMPEVLAGARPEMRQVYTQMLAVFEQTLDKHRLPSNDVASAAAMYASGAYGAYHGTQVSDAAFAALVTQLRDVLAATPEFASASMAQKQDMYEAWAITGMLMAVSAQQSPGDASVRSTARSYLETFLRASADSIQITERGMSVASGVLPTAAPALAPNPTPAGDVVPTPPRFSSTRVTALLWKTEMRYEAFPANSMVMSEQDYLLLADGTCTDRVPRSLDGFDPSAERAAHPKAFCRWRKQGTSYEVAFDGKWRAVTGATVLRGAKRGERLTGTWSRSKTGTVGAASTWNGTTLVLTADGRFELANRGAFTTNGNLARPDGEVVVSGTFGNGGGRATVSGNNVGGSTRTRGRAPGETAGTYALDGFDIELRYDSGGVERQMFGISTDGNHVFVRLAGDMMSKKK